MKVNITLDKDQKIGQPVIDAFQCELTRRIQSVFPSTRVTVKKGSMTGVELMGFDKDSDREALDSIIQEARIQIISATLGHDGEEGVSC